MEDGKQLIVRAFLQARESGKFDWYRMTTAVLKNRLLALTNRRFTEADYGATSWTDFVSNFSDILYLDRDTSPTVVELRPETRNRLLSDSESHLSRTTRIKGEFWRAMFDRSSGNTYYWLVDRGEVGTSQTEGRCPILPTIDAHTDRQWRMAFVESLSQIPEDATKWAESLLPLAQLPTDLRYQWNRVLTNKVHQRLLNWFDEQNLEPPPDLITEVLPRQERRGTDLIALKSLVHRVVQEMTEDELLQLPLPPRAVLRATTSRTA